MKEKGYGLFTTVAMIIGVVIGSGIFFKSDNILVATNGSIALGVLVFCIAAIAIIFGSLTISELAARNSEAGGLIAYAEQSYNKSIACAFGWFQTFLYFPTLIAVVAYVAGIYICLLFGINGSSIVFPIVFALCIANTGVNAELVNAGKAPTAIINLQMFRYVLIGGAGNTLGLVLLMCKSKSKHIRSIGRLSVLPGICGINEPIIFGTPIVLNPILSIPFLIMPCLSAGLGYLVQSMGLVSLGYIVDPSFTPFFAQGFLSALDIRNVIFMFVLIALSVVVYYPFFKVYEKNTLEHEGE